jgi:ABC-type polar amino acid transport system ATPase subunit
MSTAIRVRELAKRFGADEVLRGVTLDVERGEVAAIIGSSGSGKSTFLRCLNGLERLDSGTIEIAGTTLRAGLEPALEQRLHSAIRARVGMVFQQFHLFPHLSVLENVVEAPIRVTHRPPESARARWRCRARPRREGVGASGTLSGGGAASRPRARHGAQASCS